MTELTDNLLQLFCVFICGCCSCISAIRNRSYNRLLVLLFYLSFGMGLAYWVLYLMLLGTSPLVFCVSELRYDDLRGFVEVDGFRLIGCNREL